jgi:DNA-directed RNA polymerase specialized sigma24 family protein
MGSSMDSFDRIMERVRVGDNDAAAAVERRFVRRLIALAREQFETRIRDRADVEDVVQSVYQSFFARCEAGQFDLMCWEQLWGLLALMTLRKCANRREYLHAARRDARREVLGVDLDGHPIPSGRQPTPEEAVALSELVDQLLGRLQPPERAIIELTLLGLDAAEIALRLGRSERTVRRVREHVRSVLIASLVKDAT